MMKLLIIIAVLIIIAGSIITDIQDRQIKKMIKQMHDKENKR